ncbi:MAG: hypothetical protein JW841_03600 [Deltaproteobacteria bacterium]|nr:hypothetical protein [Deltaproteobacteria bacterium]
MGLFKMNGSDMWWMSYTVHHRQVRESTGTANKRIAESTLAKKKTEIIEGKWFPNKKRGGLTVAGLRDL